MSTPSKLINSEFIQQISGLSEHDADNLMFLLKSDNEVLCDWYEQMDSDDHKYAEELLAIFKEALINKEIENSLIKDDCFNEANQLINSIRYRN